MLPGGPGFRLLPKFVRSNVQSTSWAASSAILKRTSAFALFGSRDPSKFSPVKLPLRRGLRTPCGSILLCAAAAASQVPSSAAGTKVPLSCLFF